MLEEQPSYVIPPSSQSAIDNVFRWGSEYDKSIETCPSERMSTNRLSNTWDCIRPSYSDARNDPYEKLRLRKDFYAITDKPSHTFTLITTRRHSTDS
jgi:hypothetical protein